MCLRTTCTACAVWFAPVAQAQQKFPAKPIRLVTTSAGATPDTLARLIGSRMSENRGQPVVIENRPAAIEFVTVAKATPDGYTLLLASAALAIRAVLIPNLPYDTLKDFAGVTEIGKSNTALLVGAGLGVKSVKELAAYAEARPGKIFFATGAAGRTERCQVLPFASLPVEKGRVEDRLAPALPHQTVHAVFPHTTFRCSSRRRHDTFHAKPPPPAATELSPARRGRDLV